MLFVWSVNIACGWAQGNNAVGFFFSFFFSCVLVCEREPVCFLELFPFRPAQTWDLWLLSNCAHKKQAQQRTLKGLFCVLPPAPLLSPSHWVSLVMSVPLSKFSVGLKGHYDSALPPLPSLRAFALSVSHTSPHTPPYSSFACRSRHSSGSAEM